MHTLALIRIFATLLTGWALVASAAGKPEYSTSEIFAFSGMPDGSAAAALDGKFFAAASDEENILRIYNRDEPSKVLWSINLNSFLKANSKHPESDIEAAARIGDRIYWISSGSSSRSGHTDRNKFFATDIVAGKEFPKLKPAGKPNNQVLVEMANDPQFEKYNLKSALNGPAKGDDSLNVEGLSAMPDGQLLIGLRAPLYKDKALAIPLLNPAEVVEGKPAKFGPAKELALGYRGIRDIAFFQGTYYILATGEKHLDPPQLFTWTGGDAEPVKAKGAHLHHLNPEGLVIFPDLEGRRILVLSDDGQASKAKSRNFRAVWLDRLPEKP